MMMIEIGKNFSSYNKIKEEVLGCKPFSYTYDSCAGESSSTRAIWAVVSGGKQVRLKECGEAKFGANHTPDREWDCQSVRDQLAELKEVTGLIVASERRCSWEDTCEQEYRLEDFRDGLFCPTNGSGWEIYIPLTASYDAVRAERRSLENLLRITTGNLERRGVEPEEIITLLHSLKEFLVGEVQDM